MSSKYEVFSTAGGRFTATNNARSERASQRDYRVFDTRAEAQAWADEKNGAAAHKPKRLRYAGHFPPRSKPQ